MKQDNNAYRTDNLCHFGDSSNHAKEGEGVPEQMQRLRKEQQAKEFAKMRAKEISQKLLKGIL